MKTANETVKIRFGKLLRIARDKKKISRASLAVRLGISHKTVQSWEMGRTFIEELSLIPELEQELEISFSTMIEASVNGDPGRNLPPVTEDRLRKGPYLPEFSIAPIYKLQPRVLAKEFRELWVAVPVVTPEVVLHMIPDMRREDVERNILIPRSWVPRGGVLVATRMNDGGMEPRIFLGDMLIVDCRPPVAAKSIDKVLAFDFPGRGLRFRQLHVEASSRKMIAGGWDNLHNRRRYLYQPEKGCRLVGRVIGVSSRL